MDVLMSVHSSHYWNKQTMYCNFILHDSLKVLSVCKDFSLENGISNRRDEICEEYTKTYTV